MAQKQNVQLAVINGALTGNNTIIANPSKNAFMYIWELALVVGGITNLTFYNGAGALTGAMAMLANGSFFREDNNTPLFTIDPGASFIVGSSGTTIQLSGWCKYSN